MCYAFERKSESESYNAGRDATVFALLGSENDSFFGLAAKSLPTAKHADEVLLTATIFGKRAAPKTSPGVAVQNLDPKMGAVIRRNVFGVPVLEYEIWIPKRGPTLGLFFF